MKPNQHIQDEVEKTFRSIEGIERAEPTPFFLTRTQARLARHTTSQSLTGWVFRPAYVLASLGLVLLLNLSAVAYAHQQVAQYEQDQETVVLSAEWGNDLRALDW
ncbi:MAG: hypothetical protein H7319_03020 [Spirosoma sp.]|nr:hypothetical protein [Spirosoma sp.]